MDRTVKSYPHHLCHAASVITVGLVDLRLQYRPHVPRLDTDHRQARFSKSTVKPLRQWPGFQPNPFEVVGGFVSTANSASGSLATFTSRTILPVSSTMQTLVSLTDTSNPAKWSMLRFSFCCLRP